MALYAAVQFQSCDKIRHSSTSSLYAPYNALVQAIETMQSQKSDSTPNITPLYPTNPMQIQKPYAIKGTRVELGGALGISKPNADEKAASP
jgi:hypothetical protein